MTIQKRPADLISQTFSDEINQTLKQLYNLSLPKGYPIFQGQGLAVVGSDLYKTPFVACISIPLPITVDEATEFYDGWMKFQDKALLIPSCQPADLKAELIKHVVEEAYKKNINLDLNLKLSAFWTSQLKEAGVSFQEQVKKNKRNVVTGFFSLFNADKKCILFNYEIGSRIV